MRRSDFIGRNLGPTAQFVAAVLTALLLMHRGDALAQQPATPLARATPIAEGPTEYVDPVGRFTLPLPTGWTAATYGEFGVLTSPEGGISVRVLAIPGDDVAAAIAKAWQIVEPGFDFDIDEVLDVPATAGLPAFTAVTYKPGSSDESVQAVGRLVEGIVYAALVRADPNEAARRTSQLQSALFGLELTGTESEEPSLLGVQPRSLTPETLEVVDAYVATTMERFAIPGAAYAVVQDGQIVHAAGFGVRELGGSEPVTPQTMMRIGSVTKPMTTTYMATVVDAGRMRWDEPAVDVLPSFAVADPEVTPTLTMRDLVCACTGVPNRDLELIFEGGGSTAAEIIASLREFVFYTPVGEAFQYSNQMAAAGGYITAIADGGALQTVFDDYVAALERRVLDPIGMDNTTFDVADVRRGGNYAVPHARALDGTVTTVPVDMENGIEIIAPAAGAWSTIEDLGNYLIMQLNHGLSPDGERVASLATLEETWAPGVQIAPGISYGLGWVVSDFKGQPLVFHTGGTLGYNAEVAFLPEAGLGVAVMANESFVLAFAEAVRTRVLEVAFDQTPAGDDVVDFTVQQQDQAIAERVSSLLPLNRDAVTPFLGIWRNPSLGEVNLELESDRLLLDAGEFVSELVASNDVASGETAYLTATPPLAGLRISLQDDGGTHELVVYDTDSTERYVFTPVDDAFGTPAATPTAP